MLCVILTSPHDLVKNKYADLYELRLDYFPYIDLHQIKQIRQSYDKPMIFTLRSVSQGGKFNGPDEEKLALIKTLASLKPCYIDLEMGTPIEFIKEIKSSFPEVKILLSFHNFKETPNNLSEILSEMKQYPADLYKIATMTHIPTDAFRLLELNENNITTMGMGEYGDITRILGPVFGAPITYAKASAEHETAPGQVDAQMLVEMYRFKELSSSTSLYGLIGDPVSGSISNFTHNMVFREMGIDAVYIKIRVPTNELKQVLDYAKKLKFKGLSVTMPLKEVVIPYLGKIDPFAQKIKAVNTIVFEDSLLIGYNTDAKGALDAIEMQTKVKDKNINILGAGGATRAIAVESLLRGAHVKLINRTPEKAQKLAKEIGCDHGNLDQYDILINCTPNPLPLNPDDIIPGTHIMETKTKPKETALIQEALVKECLITYGYEMFIGQALGQFELWFKNQLNFKLLKEKLEESALMIFN